MVGITFRVTMYGQSFPIFSHSIKCALGMPRLDAHLSSFALEVQALTQGELATISTTLFGAHRVFLYCWIFQASMDRCYIPHLFFLLLYPSYRDLAINCSVNSWHSHKLVVRHWPGYSWYFDLLSRLLFLIKRSSFCVPCFLYPWGCKFRDRQCQECLTGWELLG